MDHSSSWPFREPSRGILLSPEKRGTHQLLATLTTKENTYDQYWLLVDSIERTTRTILMCARCSTDLRTKKIQSVRGQMGSKCVMFDHNPKELTDLSNVNIAVLYCLSDESIIRRNGCQQKHCMGQTIVYWSSTMRVVDTNSCDAHDSSVVLLRAEHGPFSLDESPLRFESMLRGMRYLKQHA